MPRDSDRSVAVTLALIALVLLAFGSMIAFALPALGLGSTPTIADVTDGENPVAAVLGGDENGDDGDRMRDEDAEETDADEDGTDEGDEGDEGEDDDDSSFEIVVSSAEDEGDDGGDGESDSSN
ncbi:hypothetical protein [Halomontanus rarus]|uniref:hypothetical protein n=1 Tax=Halomontanus rarus TaxID=3034020 RepID=UPI0023E8D50B|nr:hypothetical protein [Halovivax sp. TS33]